MEDRGVGEAIAELLAVDVAVCDRAGLTGVVRLAQRVRGWVDAVDVAIARRSKELAAEGRSESAAEVLTGYGRRSTRGDPAVSDRSEVCEQMPGFENALADGVVSAGHVDAVANAAKGLDDAARERLGGLADALLSFARVEPVSRVRAPLSAAGQTPRRRRRRKRVGQAEGVGVGTPLDRQTTGMHHTHLALDPDANAKLWCAIDAQLATIKQLDGNAGAPIDVLLADAVGRVGVGTTIR